MRFLLSVAFLGWALGVFAQESAMVPAQQASSALATSPSTAVDTSSRIYIPVGDATVRRVLLAVEPSSGQIPAAREFFATIQSNMSFTGLFELLPQEKIPGNRLDLLNYKVLGVEFLIRSTVTLNASGQVEAEVRLFDVSRGLQVLGRKYPFVSKSQGAGRELAHSAGNDIVKTLTGEDGIFRTRLLMTCGSGKKEIFMMDFDGQNPRTITRDGDLALSPSWAPDGKRILFTSYRPAVRGGPKNPNLYLLDLVANQRRVLSAALGLNTGGAFHPRREQVAYTFSQKGRPDIYLLDLASNTRRQLVRTQFFSVEPAWSPDGSKLTFSSSATGRPHIYVSEADGSNAKRLTFAGVYNSSPNWSPRGDRIVFSGQENMRNNFNIFLIDPSGSNLARLTDSSWSSENPVFSPDGRHIAFASNRDGRYRIYVMTARGENLRQVSPAELGECKQPSWSPRL